MVGVGFLCVYGVGPSSSRTLPLWFVAADFAHGRRLPAGRSQPRAGCQRSGVSRGDGAAHRPLMGTTWSTTGRGSQTSPQEGLRTDGIRSRAQWMWTARDSVPDRGGRAPSPSARASRARVPGRLVASLGIALAGSALWAVTSVLPGRACGYVRGVACGVRGRRRSRPGRS